jgi:hypothetical protein
MVVRVTAAFIAACLVVLFALSLQPAPPLTVTTGDISSKLFRHERITYRVTNAIPLTFHGPHAVIRSPIPTRHPVVFRLGYGQIVPKDCTVLIGRFERIQTEPLPGCPIDPPFVLIIDARPEILE